MSIFENCKNTKAKGTYGLGDAIRYFVSIGNVISLPLNDSQDYDLIVDDGNSLLKVQVKTTDQCKKYNENIFSVNLRVLGGNSKENFVHKKGDEIVYDLLFVLCGNGDRYLIPKNEIKNNKSTVMVGGKKTNRFKI